MVVCDRCIVDHVGVQAYVQFAALYLFVNFILSNPSFGHACAGSSEGGGCLHEDGEALGRFCSLINRI